MADPTQNPSASAAELLATTDQLTPRMRDLELSANGFARAMTSAFTGAVTQGKALDDVLKSLVLRLSDMVLKAAMKPLTQGLADSLKDLLSGLLGGVGSGAGVAAAMGAIKPFAAGGVIGTPTYFPLSSGGVGLAGEAGPEAIMPLTRGPDGRLGVATSGAGGSVTINIATPDLDSFRGSEVYLSGQIARAVARGQRGL